MSIQQRIDDIHLEISRMQIHKHSEYHYGKLKARLAMLHAAKIKQEGIGKRSAGTGFDVKRTGDARVALIGFPSAGKSTLLSTITKTESLTAAYEFSTLTCIPGVLEYNGCTIQLLDLPGIIEGASDRKGRGREVIGVARGSDMVLMVLDASRGPESFGKTNLHLKKPVTCGLEMQRRLLIKELYECGIRLNRSPPDIQIKVKKGMCGSGQYTTSSMMVVFLPSFLFPSFCLICLLFSLFHLFPLFYLYFPYYTHPRRWCESKQHG